ncbi:MAG: hypothetical protein CM15mP95_3230 [Alphaproteobacteria bacterium]|nr:MAG: hypothetical protein CM15mP95_3230 [Alphaproteobacteria bacterium]
MKMPAKWDLISNQSANFVNWVLMACWPEFQRACATTSTIDIDGFDPSIASGTGTPSHGGFLYYEILEFLDGLSNRGDIVGVDLVEVAPDYDLSGSTTTLAAQILLNLIGRIHIQSLKLTQISLVRQCLCILCFIYVASDVELLKIN